MNNIALTYLSLGDYEKALRYLNRALEIDVKTRDQENVAVDLKNIGIILRNRGEFNHNESDINSSIEYHLRCLYLAGQLGNDDGKADLLNNLGLSYSSLHDYSNALVNFRSALKEAAALGRTGDTGTILCNIGHTYLQMGKASEARSAFLKSTDLALKTGREDVLWESYFGLGKCLESEGELTSAMSCYQKAADIIDQIRCRLSWDEQKTGFARDKWKVYEAWVDILFQRKQAGFPDSSDLEIWQTIERAKARAFVEELRQMESSRPTPLDPLHLRAQKRLTRKISGTLSELADRGLEAETRKVLLGRLEREEDAYTSLRNRLRTEAAVDSSDLLADVTPLDKIQQDLLDSETACLEFFLGEKRSFVVLITRNKLVINLLPSRPAIEDSLKAYLKVLSSPPRGRFPGFRAARRLYREFVSPLEDQLGPSIRNLIIVPEGILCYLPFETLVRDGGDESSGKYLIETYRVSYAPSVSSLALLGRPQHEDAASRRILALGDPVYARHSSSAGPGKKDYGEALRELYLDSGFDFSELKYSKKEVRDIARIFPPKSVDIYTGADATEDVVKKSPLTNYRIIHFACHGFLDERTPLRSALVLSLDEDLEEDGFLQAREIYDLRLNADLVVLSACQTGQGRLENGEGVLGLPRVFFCAGAKSIISSLWKISDRSTASLMRNFYRSLAGGADKAQSLRAAKLMMLKSRFSHPFYWAGFVLNGDYRIRPNGLSANR
jgi:CHAT domain-containing protein